MKKSNDYRPGSVILDVIQKWSITLTPRTFFRILRLAIANQMAATLSLGYTNRKSDRTQGTGALAGYVFKPVDFWENNQWSYGATIGISAPI